ncbi:SDR family NAD(P)-dependent oxidoreductase [Photobacterium sp. TY1-4]|uniref:SDR family NAD(P)-dependent oxidoreductase n=1 Tax=Photobacterium sp. TY1-4 TaxID=2899122 RepID=UPI0021BF1514|nr:SDR family NAD(P)-dependent oxidoreductase [Photobacterium sp. TY1-4]UXI00488.1 SDR family oxidoreductase [Photobacterium sp. TY1-4]
MFDLTGKTIVVTGSCRGIGLAIARALHGQGANVVITARKPAKYPDVLAVFAAAPERVRLVPCDITSPESVAALFESALAWQGTLYGCVANAGSRGSGQAVCDMDWDAWQAHVGANLHGTFATLQHAAKHLCRQGKGGRLMAISSLSAVKGTAGFADYGAGKAAITSLCRSLALELAASAITVNSVLPGWVETEMNRDVLADRRQYESIRRLRIPLGRWATPEEIAPLAVYLMSEESRYHTGDVITVDGGYRIF